MAKASPRWERLNTITVVGNYLPRRCGIATFTADLCDAISSEALTSDCWAIAMNDVPEGYSYPDRVHFELSEDKLSEYRLAASFLNINQVASVCALNQSINFKALDIVSGEIGVISLFPSRQASIK